MGKRNPSADLKVLSLITNTLKKNIYLILFTLGLMYLMVEEKELHYLAIHIKVEQLFFIYI